LPTPEAPVISNTLPPGILMLRFLTGCLTHALIHPEAEVDLLDIDRPFFEL
jgi:hypothetical protein